MPRPFRSCRRQTPWRIRIDAIAPTLSFDSGSGMPAKRSLLRARRNVICASSHYHAAFPELRQAPTTTSTPCPPRFFAAVDTSDSAAVMAEAESGAPEALPDAADSYAGYSRFEIELEFVQSLSNPLYLQYLASQKYFESREFLAYLDYLQYFQEPKYLKYLQYPGPTLRALQLLQEERFRKDILIPAVVDEMVRQGFEAATAGLSR